MIILQRLMSAVVFAATVSFSGFAIADDVHLNKAEIKALYSKVQSCWALSPELAKDKTLSVMVKVKLDKSGKLLGDVKTKATGGNAKTQAEMAASAKRAVQKCQPYKLPVEKYQAWSEIEFHFAAPNL